MKKLFILFLPLMFCAAIAFADVPDYKETKSLADRGDAAAQFNLGLMFATGQGTRRDDRQAMDWWRKSALQGNVDAQYNLGVINLRRRDKLEARKWLEMASRQGDEKAKEALDELNKR